MDDKRSSATPLFAALAILVLVIALYAGSYLAMLNGSVTIIAPESPDTLQIAPAYRFGGRWADVIFFPAHEVDRRIRPHRWALLLHPL